MTSFGNVDSLGPISMPDSLRRAGSAVSAQFRSKDVFFHDGASMRRFHLSARAQVTAASCAIAAIGLSLVGAVQLSAGAAATVAVASDARVSQMNAKVAALQAEMATIRTAAAEHAKRLDARQAMLDAVLTQGTPAVSGTLPAVAPATGSRLSMVIAPLGVAEGRQTALAGKATAVADARYHATAAVLGRLGLDPARFHRVGGAMGGPYEPMPSGDAAKGAPTGGASGDPQFRALFQSWKRLEQLQQGIVAIPSQRPVDNVTFTSGFGVRSDPFRGGAAMHAGVDMPGAMGTPIYATADGIVGRAGWASGYGNLVELDHGKGIQTRYGHLSAILVTPGTRVVRGQQIARMGSTGRSTGTHLHYEVRLDGHAVNPMPFLQSSSYLIAAQAARPGVKVAMGGPKE